MPGNLVCDSCGSNMPKGYCPDGNCPRVYVKIIKIPEVIVRFPGLRVRPIGPSDDIVVDAEALEEWLGNNYVSKEEVMKLGHLSHDPK